MFYVEDDNGQKGIGFSTSNDFDNNDSHNRSRTSMPFCVFLIFIGAGLIFWSIKLTINYYSANDVDCTVVSKKVIDGRDEYICEYSYDGKANTFELYGDREYKNGEIVNIKISNDGHSKYMGDAPVMITVIGSIIGSIITILGCIFTYKKIKKEIKVNEVE